MPMFQPNQTTICPHCRVGVRLETPSKANAGVPWITSESDRWNTYVLMSQCPNCLRALVALDEIMIDPPSGSRSPVSEHALWPRATTRPPVPQEVPANIGEDYSEAAAVVPISPKASAALSRRCLQSVLREAARTKSKDLSDQIEEVLPSLPTALRENLDSIRAVGNFAAHPLKSQQTGAILDVEPGEAEWNLDVLDAVLDFYYVRPERERKKREELNRKLQEAGKPPLKS